MKVNNKSLNQVTFSHILGSNILPVLDTSFILGNNFNSILTDYIIPAVENKKMPVIVVPLVVVEELEKKALATDNPQLSFTAKQRLVHLAGLLDKGYIHVAGKPTAYLKNAFADHVIIREVVHNILSGPIIVFTQDVKLIEALKNAYEAIGSAIAHKRPLHLINTYSYTIESIYEHENPPKSESKKDSDSDKKKDGANVSTVPQATEFLARPFEFNTATPVLYTKDALAVATDEEIGSGLEGKVFKIRNNPNIVAKIYHPTITEDAKVYADTWRKVSALSCFNHPRIAFPIEMLFDKKENGIPCGYTMPLIDAGTIHEIIVNGPRSVQASGRCWRDLLHICRSLAEEVSYLHDTGLQAIDLRPDNILVDKENNTYLIDTDSFQVAEMHTTPTIINPLYSSPKELCTAESVSYMLAMVCSQLLLCGKHPFISTKFFDPVEGIKALAFPYEVGEHTPVDGWSEDYWSLIPKSVQNAFVNTLTLKNITPINAWSDLFKGAELAYSVSTEE